MARIETAGTTIAKIDVTISYKIIELFSAGLYSSPNKAFEELVCNSYDAFADTVSVFVSPDLTVNDAHIWVCDNGESMDEKGLKDLWRIGESLKRTADRDAKRLQVGRFGIGKLATYILAHNLTYLCKKGGRFLVVTMDFRNISEKDEALALDERELSAREAEDLLTPYTRKGGQDLVRFKLFGSDAEENWTFSILTNLKPKAQEIREGRLKWVLRTALPLSPGFTLFYNGSQVDSSKIDKPLKKKWVFGKDDATAEASDSISVRHEAKRCLLDFESLKGVFGEGFLYEDSLVEGKSSAVGRSHGIFLMVRGRLINLDDPLLGMEAFSHGVFNRLQIVVHADELDDNLTSTRESIKESAPLSQLKDYLKKKINNEIRKFYFEEEDREEKRQRISYRLSQTSLTASKRPLLVFAEKYFKGEILNPLLIEKLDPSKSDAILDELRAELSEDQSIIKDVAWGLLDPADRIAKLNIETGILTINLIHPFIANYIEEYRSKLPLEFLAITEVLTEAHLYELGIDEQLINSVVKRRDSTLRELSLSDREGSPAVALLLRDALADPTGLEDAVYRAFLSLGFEAKKIGGNGKPDGLASAVLGYSSEDKNESYSITFDAKSTKKNSIQANTTHLATIVKHKKDYNADYAVVVAIDFEGAEKPDSTISVTTKQQKVTAIRARDLMRLLLLSAPKQIGLTRIRNMLDTCHTPSEITEWIDAIESENIEIGPIKELLDIIYELQTHDTEPPEIAGIRQNLNKNLPAGKQLSKEKIRAIVDSLMTFVPGFISIEGEKVGISGKPDKIMSVVSTQISTNVPSDLQQTYLKAFSTKIS